MFLHTKLENRTDPIRVAFIGCGKFVSMFLAQYNHLNKIEIDSIIDINIDQAKKKCSNSGLNAKTINKIYSRGISNCCRKRVSKALKQTYLSNS